MPIHRNEIETRADQSVDQKFMLRALELAKNGQGFVEPNPMVGCVIVRENQGQHQILGEGFHQRFGGPHAEIEALRAMQAVGHPLEKTCENVTCYVTLEPCSHHGKTPPCVEALIASGIRRVVVAMRDPHPAVNGRGIEILRQAGIEVTENVLEQAAHDLNAPYLARLETVFTKRRPWILAKWAMTLDGRTASHSGSSQWISGEKSRQVVHQIRARMDAVMVGIGTALADNPLLTVRGIPVPSQHPNRQPLRVILDSRARLPLESQLVQTAKSAPVLLIVGRDADQGKLTRLEQASCEILSLESCDHDERMGQLLRNLAERGVMNLLVEGGYHVFGTLFDRRVIDEVHVFMAPKLIGGQNALPAIGGLGMANMTAAAQLREVKTEILQNDVYFCGKVCYT